ncbi:hypothetical protein BH10BAC2_BH10BAC2_06030 [soil metagenome]
MPGLLVVGLETLNGIAYVHYKLIWYIKQTIIIP